MSIFDCKNKNRNKIAKLMLFALNFYGVYPFTENVNIFKRYRLIVYYLLMFGIASIGNVVMLTESNAIVAIQAFCFIFGTAYFYLIVLISIRNGKNLRFFLESIVEENDEWSELSVKFDTVYRDTSYERIRKLHNWFAVYNVVSISSVVAYPLTNVALKIANLGDASSLIFVAWYPWNVNDWRWYTITYIMQSLTATIYQSIMYGTIALNLITWRLFTDEFDELRYIVRNLIDDASQSEFDKLLKLCIVRYQTIVKNFNQYKKWFEDIYATQLVYFTIQFVSFGLLIFSVPNLVVRNTVLLFNITIILYVYCLIGEAFYSLNEKIRQALYNHNWYGKDRKTVKIISMFMSQLQRPLRLRAFKTFPASLPVFFSILKSSYSFLNLVLATMK